MHRSSSPRRRASRLVHPPAVPAFHPLQGQQRVTRRALDPLALLQPHLDARPRHGRHQGQARRDGAAREPQARREDADCRRRVARSAHGRRRWRWAWREGRTRRKGRHEGRERRLDRPQHPHRRRWVRRRIPRARHAQGKQIRRDLAVRSSITGLAVRSFRSCGSSLSDSDVKTPSIATVHASVDSIRTHGFINYYGMQRFGTAPVPTHVVGLALLRSEWALAAELILSDREGEQQDIYAARQLWKEGKKAEAAKVMPRRAVAERARESRSLSRNSLSCADRTRATVLDAYQRGDANNHLGAISTVRLARPLLPFAARLISHVANRSRRTCA